MVEIALCYETNYLYTQVKFKSYKRKLSYQLIINNAAIEQCTRKATCQSEEDERGTEEEDDRCQLDQEGVS